MKHLLLAIPAWLAAIASPLAAQELTPLSCPEADSIFGPPPAQGMKTIKGKWADVEGITTYRLLSNTSAPLFKDGTMEFRIVAMHEGRKYAPPIMQAQLEFEVIASQDNAFKDQDLNAKSQAEAMKELPVLVDDTLRFRILATRGTAKTSNNFFVGRKRVERFSYDLTEEQVRNLTLATSVRIRAGDRMLKLERADFGSVRSFYRNVICSGGLSAGDD